MSALKLLIKSLFIIALFSLINISCVERGEIPKIISPGKTETEETTKKVSETINDRIAKILANPNRPVVTNELLAKPELAPVTCVKVDGSDFCLSKIIQGDYKFAVAYVDKPPLGVVARLFYKSNSDGGWRSAPAIGDYANPKWIWKGDYYNLYVKKDVSDPDKMFRERHYTQDTKPQLDIASALTQLDEAHDGTLQKDLADFLNEKFNYQNLENNHVLTIHEELFHTYPVDNDIKSLLHYTQKYMPGSSFEREVTKLEWDLIKINPAYVVKTKPGAEIDAIDLFLNDAKIFARLGKDFIPSFLRDSHVHEYKMNHTLLSDGKNQDITVRVFESRLDDRVVQWHMATDKKGRTWIDRIFFKDAKVNSYGILSEVINSGYLTNKPLEYDSQIGPKNKKYAASTDNPRYLDLSCILRLVPPIRTYINQYSIKITEDKHRLREICDLIDQTYEIKRKKTP